MRPESSAASWLKFFSAAGINTEAAEHYAVTFSKNQIQLDMLPEINKHYLNDMGISLLGHVIAILRHAKTVYADEVKRSELSSSKRQVINEMKEKPATKPSKPPLTSKPSEQVVKPINGPSGGKRKSTIVQLNTGNSPEPKSKVRKKLCDSSDDVALPPVKSTSIVRSDDVDEMKKGIFKRLGSEVNPSPAPPENFSQPNGNNSESVFSRLGGKSNEPQVAKVVAFPTTRLAIECEINRVNKPAVKKSIIRTRLDKPKRILVSPTYMDNVLDRQSQPIKKITSNTSPYSYKPISRSVQERKGVKTRLGISSTKLASFQSTGSNAKKVSFGSVCERIIPRANKTLKSAAFSLNGNQKLLYSDLYLNNKQKTTTKQTGLQRPLSIIPSSGVFSRLGT